MDKSKKSDALYSILIPVYNSEEIIENTVNLTIKFMDDWSLRYEIVLVNDGSPDGSWGIIRALANQHAHVIAINLLRNFGQHSAVLCAMAHANGDYLITMDDDLQNPPGELIKLINCIDEGFDLVFARFAEKKHAGYRRWGTRLINYINGKIFNKPKDIVLTNFRIFTRTVAKQAVAYKTYHPYIPGLLLMHAGRIGNVLTEHHSRELGSSNYSLVRIMKLVSRLLFNYSSYPLRVLVVVGFGASAISLGMGVYFVLTALIAGSSVPGWSSIVVLMSFFNGILIALVGIVGIYVSRILRELSTTRAYQIQDIVGAEVKAELNE